MTKVHSLHLDQGEQHLATSPSWGGRLRGKMESHRHRRDPHHVLGPSMTTISLPPRPETELHRVEEASMEEVEGNA